MRVKIHSRLNGLKKSLLALTILGLFLSSSGCVSTRPSFDNPYASVGAEHNRGLEYVLAELKKPRTGAPPTTRADGVRIATEAVRRFLTENRIRPELIEIVDEGVAIAELPDDPANPLAGIEDLPSIERPYATRMLATLRGDANLAETRRQIASEARLALVTLGAERAKRVLIGAAVADSSLAYWERNLDDWSTTVARTYQANPVEAPPRTEKSVTKEDIKGAIKGAITGAAKGGLGGAIEGAAVGAFASSVAEMVVRIFESLFG